MNRFRSNTPRVATAIGAVAMTLITIGLLIVVPATIESDGEGIRTQAMNVVPPAATTARDRTAAIADLHHQS